MEPSKIIGCEEECSSSASGWTMYICSPAHENHNHDDDDDDDNSNTCKQEDASKNVDGHGGDDDDNKSDDSMASDASSGPSYQDLSWDRSKQSLDKHATGKYSKQKLHKKEKRDESRIKIGGDDEQPLLKAKSAASEAGNGAKVRKSK